MNTQYEGTLNVHCFTLTKLKYVFVSKYIHNVLNEF